MGTLLTVRCAELATLCSALGVPWICEQPLIRESFPSAFKLTECLRVRELATTTEANCKQCPFRDLVAREPSLIFARNSRFVGNVPLEGLVHKRECTHTATWWTRPSVGHRV